MAKFKAKYQKRFKKSFKSFNPIFSSNEFLKLKLNLSHDISKKIDLCIDREFDDLPTDEQLQINKELRGRFSG
tara:strand:- start:14337 stop:14555 length:219 start_codon:yes stop_codon:yes gene_type:complete